MNSVVPVLRNIQRTYCDDLNNLVQYMAELDPINWDEYEFSVREVCAVLHSHFNVRTLMLYFSDRRRRVPASTTTECSSIFQFVRHRNLGHAESTEIVSRACQCLFLPTAGLIYSHTSGT